MGDCVSGALGAGGDGGETVETHKCVYFVTRNTKRVTIVENQVK